MHTIARHSQPLQEPPSFCQGISAILLAGGKSSRMGRDKASLPFRGMSLLEWQAQKLGRLGVSDILLAGSRRHLAGTRTIPDEYPGRGPLSGLHACLKQARYPACLTLSVDMPLVPAAVFAALVQAHREREPDIAITLLRHGGKWEPLLGIYQRDLHPVAERILQGERTAVRRLIEAAGVQFVDWPETAELFLNCNSPADFATLQAMASESEASDIRRNGEPSDIQREAPSATPSPDGGGGKEPDLSDDSSNDSSDESPAGSNRGCISQREEHW